MKPIIEVHNISKRFKIYHQQPYLSMRDALTRAFSRIVRNTSAQTDKTHLPNNEGFWALKEVSFNVYEGESIGIIGRNGAGKSTLLKILSRITPPTKGHIILRGRVASLLEVGTGFHPELTGRENVYFNGAILGMKRAEIKRKFDEIVDFAGVEKFIDTPLKHYSSGMQLRLAFAVAAFLEAEILVVDEVLAVGDAEFQKKCLGKMEEVTQKEGRTVLFVSHNMGAVSNLCQRGIWLESGEVKGEGIVTETIKEYVKNISRITNKQFPQIKSEYIRYIRINNTYNYSENVTMHIEMHKHSLSPNLTLGIGIENDMGSRVVSAYTQISEQNYTIELAARVLPPGIYKVSIGIHYDEELIEKYEQCISFEVQADGTFYEHYRLTKPYYGVISPDCFIKIK